MAWNTPPQLIRRSRRYPASFPEDQSNPHSSTRGAPSGSAAGRPNRAPALVVCAIALGTILWTTTCPAEEWIALELYLSGTDSDADVQAWAESAVGDRECVSLRVYDLAADEDGRERFESICSYYKLDTDDSVPLLYGCGTTIIAPESERDLSSAVDDMLTVTVFVRSGCPRCARAKQFFEPMMRRFPGFEIVYRDVATDGRAANDMQAIARRYQQSAVSVPVFHFCNQVIIGFDRESTTGRRLESALDHWTFTREGTSSIDVPRPEETPAHVSFPARPAGERPESQSTLDRELVLRGPGSPMLLISRIPVSFLAASLVSFSDPDETDSHGRDPPSADESDDAAAPPPLPLPGPPPLPLPPDLPLPPAEVNGNDAVAESVPAEDIFHIPFYGETSASELSARFGLPVFTIIIGLIDGFNPCAMWVLLFLLSILVNLKSRWRILAVAGTFVLISGLAYFAFMAAWLTVWSWFKYLRPAEVVLGMLAVAIGAIHIKDFFAFKKGVSLSIPESAKPGIYSRVRGIVMAENIWGAIAGASVLAVLVNVIELLCTAGLPALYTNVLTRQGLDNWQEYAYIGLYNLAYMFDDGLMVGVVVLTLGRHKLQERQGRWLKLVSGLVVLALGLVLLFNPELLQWEFGAPAE